MSEFMTNAKLVTARKEHYCIAYKTIMETGYGEEDFDCDEWAQIMLMKDKGGKIEVGEEYLCWSGISDGEFFTSRANIEMEKIVSRYEWWGE